MTNGYFPRKLLEKIAKNKVDAAEPNYHNGRIATVRESKDDAAENKVSTNTPIQGYGNDDKSIKDNLGHGRCP